MTSALRLTLDSDALVANWRWFARASGKAACGAAVKADGYGLGAREVLERLARAGCRDFFVATWDEAAALGPIDDALSLTVLHGVRESDLPAALGNAARPVLNTPAMVARWKAAAPERPCDVMIDTGMNRLGLTPAEARSDILAGLPIRTLMSHLACAEDPSAPMNRRQADLFRALAGLVRAERYSLANSAGICLGEVYAFDLTRPGLGLYGGVPGPGANGHVRPVARIEAEVLQVRQVAAGESVGYGATFVAERPTRVAILNIGYADGYLRAFGGKGSALSGDVACPVVGRVSMDLLAIDVSGADVTEGDWLEIEHDLPTAAAATGLSQYELLTTLGDRFERRWV